MKKIVIIVAPKDYRDEEFEEPREIFDAKGFEVTIASKGVEIAKGALGGNTRVDIDVYDISVDNYDAFVFVGGSGAKIYFEDRKIEILVRQAAEKGKVLGAICIAPTILGNAGVLMGKKVASWASQEENLKSHGAEYTGNLVEVDGKIVTANGPKAAKEFGEKIAKLLE